MEVCRWTKYNTVSNGRTCPGLLAEVSWETCLMGSKGREEFPRRKKKKRMSHADLEVR